MSGRWWERPNKDPYVYNGTFPVRNMHLRDSLDSSYGHRYCILINNDII